MAPSVMLKKLSGYKQQNRLHLALQEIGRIERTLFTMDWLESPELRRRCQAGLNKGEARHFLAHAIFVPGADHRSHVREPELSRLRSQSGDRRRSCTGTRSTWSARSCT